MCAGVSFEVGCLQAYLRCAARKIGRCASRLHACWTPPNGRRSKCRVSERKVGVAGMQLRR